MRNRVISSGIAQMRFLEGRSVRGTQEHLRAKISNLESELEKKEAEIRGLQAQVSVYRNRSVGQASAPDPQNMRRAELEKAIEAANKRGDTEAVSRLYRELKTR
jgi:SMC interacting uncharacterized protein involved in chromosome segregation